MYGEAGKGSERFMLGFFIFVLKLAVFFSSLEKKEGHSH